MDSVFERAEARLQEIAPELKLPETKPLFERTVFAMFVPAPDRPSPAFIEEAHVEAVLGGISSDATRIFEGVFADDEQLVVVGVAWPQILWELDAPPEELQAQIAEGRVDPRRRANAIQVEIDLNAQVSALTSFLGGAAVESRFFCFVDEEAGPQMIVCCCAAVRRSQIEAYGLLRAIAGKDFGADQGSLQMSVLFASEARPLFFMMPDDRFCEIFAPTAEPLEVYYARYAELLDPVERGRMEATFGFWPGPVD